MKTLEIACFNLESARRAARCGVGRIEFCAGYAAGGVTPDLADFESLRAETSIPVVVMIRPRGGDFNYSRDEIGVMREQIGVFRAAGADGFVFGVLQGDRTVDQGVTRDLVGLANALPCTFHRAFDEAPELVRALDAVIECGCKRLLSSGGGGTAWENREVLRKLHVHAADRITLLAGGGVRSDHASELIRLTGLSEIHSSALPAGESNASEEEIRALLACAVASGRD